MTKPMPGRRGRPPKYGSPSKIVAVTLPEDIVNQLLAIHEDLGWAIVRVVEQLQSRRVSGVPSARKARPAADPDQDRVERQNAGPVCITGAEGAADR